MVAEEIVVILSGGAPWGFRLQGGSEHQKPLQVAKVRKRSKACRAGLKEHDELVAIGDHLCSEMSHVEAMSLLDKQSTTLHLRVKRTPAGFHSSLYPSRVLSPTSEPFQQNHSSLSILHPTGITSPPDSEAYYGETDSDADTQSLTAPRRQRRPSPHARSPARYDQNEEETSEMSGYESATDPVVTPHQWDVPYMVGVPRRELIYQPLQPDWETPTHTPHTLTPHTLTPHTLSPTNDQSLGEEGEGDSGFQETGGTGGTGGSGTMACPPLVSPERAKEALMLGCGTQLVPMVGPQEGAVNDELSTTYKDKARQAKLQRAESVVEKQVKEARTKCRSIASLLTDAPNPNSKGVLMFKKRRQRAKKYTLTCFGKAPEDRGTESETGGETEEEGGSSILSGSELDEEGFSGSFDPTWDSGYFDLLERRSSACPSTTPTTPTTPTTNHSQASDLSADQTAPFELSNSTAKLEAISGLDILAYQDSMLENGIANQPVNSLPYCAPMSPPAMPSLTNGGSAVSHASVVLNPPPSQTPVLSQHTQQGNPNPGNDMNSSFSPNTNVLNRTARPFTPGPSAPSRPTVTSVMFRPPQPKPMSAPAQPVTAVSMTTISPVRQPDSKRAVSSTSLYIPARNTNGNSSDISSIQSPPSSLSSATTISQPATNPPTFSLPASVNASQPYNPPPPQQLTTVTPNYPYAATVLPVSQPYNPEATQVHLQAPPAPPVNSYFNAQPSMSSMPPSNQPSMPPSNQPSMAPRNQPSMPPSNQPSMPPRNQPSMPPSNQPSMPPRNQPSMPPSNLPPSPQAPTSDSLATREQRISVPAARTGILNDARRRSTKKPMFAALHSKDVNPNPDLLSMVQNMDDRFIKGPNVETNTGAPTIAEVGHESGPEEDWLRLGAEACNFMQAQRQSKPPPVAPKPQAPILPQMPQVPQMPQLGGKGGQLFAKRQNRMDRYIVERSPSVAPFSPSQTREPSPTPSLPATWKYSSNIRAPPPINYNPLLSPSCPLKAQKKHDSPKVGQMKAQKPAVPKPVDFMNHQPYQLNSSLFSYGNGCGGVPQNLPNPSIPGNKTARVVEVKRFSTPPPTSTGPALKLIAPRSATTLGEPMWHSNIASPPPQTNATPYQALYQAPYQQPQWDPAPLSPPPPPAPNCPLPQLPTFSSPPVVNSTPSPAQANRQFKSVPDLSPITPVASSSQSTPQIMVPRPRFSTSNLGLQPCVWRPGSTMY